MVTAMGTARAIIVGAGPHVVQPPTLPRCHGGPTRPTPGVLVYTIFVLEMLVRLRHLGFVTNLYQLQAPWRGIFGPNAIVFEAIKLS